MVDRNEKEIWEKYREQELGKVGPILKDLGVTLDPTQAHTMGERFLMTGERDVGGGGYKLVLTGTQVDGKRVVIKVSSDHLGKKEIETERQAREILQSLKFAYYVIFSPEEILYTEREGNTIYITTYIEQEKNFLERPIKEQFALAVTALKSQEGLHATTYSHAKVIRRTFGMWGAKEYLESFAKFKNTATSHDPTNQALAETLKKAQEFLETNSDTIEQYCGFLTHADFVPHNLRVEGHSIYLLDYASLHFGNKHESWARFCNFMLVHNRPLEEALVNYVEQNRTPEESLSLRLMRVYKIGFLLSYYTENVHKSSGDLRVLSQKRMELWRQALEALLSHVPLSNEVIETYKQQRNTLQSAEEKERQKNLH